MTPVRRTNWSKQPWLLISADDLQTERRQCAEEGLDLAGVADEFAELATLDLTEETPQQRAEALLDRTPTLPRIEGYPFVEPSDLAGIQHARPHAVALPVATLDAATRYDKALGGWQGRASGCLLGKPVEGKRSGDIAGYLRAQGRWPLDRYFSRLAPEGVAAQYQFDLAKPGQYEEDIVAMVEDDDTNYTVAGLAIVQKYGLDFTPAQVATFWLDNLPIFHVCTAERVAYKNLVNGIAPPDSARYRNVYREWIGAQIRADFFGYVNPGDPERAAAFAWRDAAISHVKNGIYGEMWVAAMLAAAYVCDDIASVIRAGLAQVPASSRLSAAITHTLALHAAGASYDDAIADLRTRWDETQSHAWCHTISNAEIVAIALLWGAQDFTRTLGYSVMPGFDTDCNAATAGSVLGVLLGASRLPAAWIAPLQDTLYTGVSGYHRVALTQMAEATVGLMATPAASG
ncbi:MAG TPA: ADP-ribosylglycohydrolase family protein [Armatimonadota bacterium]|jgi:ADP-ribosylglycohydrolase